MTILIVDHPKTDFSKEPKKYTYVIRYRYGTISLPYTIRTKSHHEFVVEELFEGFFSTVSNNFILYVHPNRTEIGRGTGTVLTVFCW